MLFDIWAFNKIIILNSICDVTDLHMIMPAVLDLYLM